MVASCHILSPPFFRSHTKCFPSYLCRSLWTWSTSHIRPSRLLLSRYGNIRFRAVVSILTFDIDIWPYLQGSSLWQQTFDRLENRFQRTDSLKWMEGNFVSWRTGAYGSKHKCVNLKSINHGCVLCITLSSWTVTLYVKTKDFPHQLWIYKLILWQVFMCWKFMDHWTWYANGTYQKDYAYSWHFT